MKHTNDVNDVEEGQNVNTLSEIENITKRVSSSCWKNFINRKPLLLQCLTDIQAALKEELQQHN